MDMSLLSPTARGQGTGLADFGDAIAAAIRMKAQMNAQANESEKQRQFSREERQSQEAFAQSMADAARKHAQDLENERQYFSTEQEYQRQQHAWDVQQANHDFLIKQAEDADKRLKENKKDTLALQIAVAAVEDAMDAGVNVDYQGVVDGKVSVVDLRRKANEQRVSDVNDMLKQYRDMSNETTKHWSNLNKTARERAVQNLATDPSLIGFLTEGQRKELAAGNYQAVYDAVTSRSWWDSKNREAGTALDTALRKQIDLQNAIMGVESNLATAELGKKYALMERSLSLIIPKLRSWKGVDFGGDTPTRPPTPPPPLLPPRVETPGIPNYTGTQGWSQGWSGVPFRLPGQEQSGPSVQTFPQQWGWPIPDGQSRAGTLASVELPSTPIPEDPNNIASDIRREQAVPFATRYGATQNPTQTQTDMAINHIMKQENISSDVGDRMLNILKSYGEKGSQMGAALIRGYMEGDRISIEAIQALKRRAEAQMNQPTAFQPEQMGQMGQMGSAFAPPTVPPIVGPYSTNTPTLFAPTGNTPLSTVDRMAMDELYRRDLNNSISNANYYQGTLK